MRPADEHDKPLDTKSDIDSLIQDLRQDRVWLKTPEQIEKRTNAITSLAANGTAQAMQALVSEWGRWIALEYDPLIVDLATQKIREKATAIMPLIALFERLETDQALRDNFAYGVLAKNGVPQQELDKSWGNLNSWIQLTKEHQNLIQSRWEETKGQLHRRIAQMLVDLSTRIQPGSSYDSLTGGESADIKQARDIRTEFEAYAVAPLVRILDKESDLEVRGCIARILGNIKNKEAIDALVLAVKGEGQRFNMLDQYYLKPAREKSSEARAILNGVLNQAKDTLKLLQWMNLAVFILGMAVLATGIIVGLTNDHMGTRIAATLTGLGGLGGVITYLIKAPLDRIQNSMSNLAQIETAFYSFIRDLDISDTYIQSQYVAKGVLSDEEIAKTMERINTISCSTMDLIESYTEEGKEPQVSHITALYPPLGQVNSEVAIKGKFPLRNDDKKEQPPVIAINHKPTLAKVTSSKTDEVKFTLANDAISPDTKEATVWISIVEQGVETNALPFQIIGGNK